MSSTKTPLEKSRIVFFQTGLIASVALALVAFTWTTADYSYSYNLADLDAGELLVDPTPISPVAQRPPAPKPQIFTHWVNPTPDPIPDPSPDPDPAVIIPVTTDIDWSDNGDDRDPEGSITLSPAPPNSVQRSARYPECESGDRLQELQCTQNMLKQYVQDLAVYPMMEREAGISGRATIQFVIDEEGNVTNIEVIRADTPGIGKAAATAVSKLPPLKPALQMGKGRAVFMQIPVSFVIN